MNTIAANPSKFYLWKKAFLKGLLILWPLQILSLFFDQILSDQAFQLLMSQDDASLKIWGYMFLMILNSLIPPLLMTLIALALITDQRPWAVLTRSFSQAFREQLRVWGKIFLWSLLLIIPGIYKLLRLYFVPYIAVLSENYEKGERDALELSQKLTHGRMGLIFGLFILFALVFPLALTSVDEYRVFLKNPVPSLIFSLVELSLTLFFIVWIYCVFKKAMKENHEPAF